MDAVEIMKEYGRMCDAEGEYGCSNCKMSNEFNGTGEQCDVFIKKYPQKAVEIVEKWAVEHPVKTRQSKFLKMFPNAMYSDSSTLMIKPCELDQTELQNGRRCDDYSGKCQSCRKEYWNEEVE